MAEDDSLGLRAQQRHRQLMRAVVGNLQDTGYVLKGGTAILFTRNGRRHSVDLDTERKANIASRVERAFKATGIEIIGVNPYKDSAARQTSRYRDRDPSTGVEDTLKVETRIMPIDTSTIEHVDGIRTYKLDALFDQKLSALEGRTQGRDLRDVTFLLISYGRYLQTGQLDRADAVIQSVDGRIDDFAQSYANDLRVSGKPEEALDDAIRALAAIDGARAALTRDARTTPSGPQE